MSIDSCAGGNMFATTEIGALTGEAGLGSRIFIEVKILPWNAPKDQAAVLGDLSADVRIQGADGRERLVGRAFLANAGVVKQYETRAPTAVRLALDLTQQQIEAWERVRLGGQFAIRLTYQGFFVRPQTGIESLSGGDQRTVSQGEWIAVLAAIGFRRLILVEVPVPDDGAHPSLALATRELRKATTHILAGHDREAVGACRLALDALAHALGEDPTKYDISALVKNNAKLGKPERFAVLRRVLTILANPAHHSDPDAAAIEWHYEDAHAILAQTAAVLGYHNTRLLAVATGSS